MGSRLGQAGKAWVMGVSGGVWFVTQMQGKGEAVGSGCGVGGGCLTQYSSSNHTSPISVGHWDLEERQKLSQFSCCILQRPYLMASYVTVRQ